MLEVGYLKSQNLKETLATILDKLIIKFPSFYTRKSAIARNKNFFIHKGQGK